MPDFATLFCVVTMSALRVIGLFLAEVLLSGLGAAVFIAVCFVGYFVFYHHYFDPLDLHFRSEIAPSVILDHELRIKFWHQNPGSLQKGVLVVKASGADLKQSPGSTVAEQVWSFDNWAPNEAATHTCTFYLTSIPKRPDLTIDVSVKAKGLQTFEKRYRWEGQMWKIIEPSKGAAEAPVVAKTNS